MATTVRPGSREARAQQRRAQETKARAQLGGRFGGATGLESGFERGGTSRAAVEKVLQEEGIVQAGTKIEKIEKGQITTREPVRPTAAEERAGQSFARTQDVERGLSLTLARPQDIGRGQAVAPQIRKREEASALQSISPGLLRLRKREERIGKEKAVSGFLEFERETARRGAISEVGILPATGFGLRQAVRGVGSELTFGLVRPPEFIQIQRARAEGILPKRTIGIRGLEKFGKGQAVGTAAFVPGFAFGKGIGFTGRLAKAGAFSLKVRKGLLLTAGVGAIGLQTGRFIKEPTKRPEIVGQTVGFAVGAGIGGPKRFTITEKAPSALGKTQVSLQTKTFPSKKGITEARTRGLAIAKEVNILGRPTGRQAAIETQVVGAGRVGKGITPTATRSLTRVTISKPKGKKPTTTTTITPGKGVGLATQQVGISFGKPKAITAFRRFPVATGGESKLFKFKFATRQPILGRFVSRFRKKPITGVEEVSPFRSPTGIKRIKSGPGISSITTKGLSTTGLKTTTATKATTDIQTAISGLRTPGRISIAPGATTGRAIQTQTQAPRLQPAIQRTIQRQPKQISQPTISKLKIAQRPRVRQIARTRTVAKQVTTPALGQFPLQKQLQAPKQLIRQRQITAQAPLERQLQRQRQISRIPLVGRPIGVPTVARPPTGRGFIVPPFFPGGGGGRGFGIDIGKKRKFKTIPSVSAAFLGLKAPGPTKLTKLRGFGLRPLPSKI